MNTQTPATVPLLHRFLGIGMVVLAVVFTGMFAVGIGPLIKEPGLERQLAWIMTGISLALGATALLVLKPRVPERRPGQSVQEYWSNVEIASKAMTTWFLLEGAGVLAAIAFLLTGLSAAGLVMAVTIAAFWMTGPNTFAKG
jgi:hypothetical protein